MATTFTFQDFEKAKDTAEFVLAAINAHKSSDAYKTAVIADKYDRQENVTVNEYARTVFSMRKAVGNDGRVKASVVQSEDRTASNNKLASNFFNRLNTQRVQYSLGNGISFVQPDEEEQAVDEVKEAMGEGFDRKVAEGAYHACKHGVSFMFWNVDHVHMFSLTEFVPLYDMYTGRLRAGIRFWRFDSNKPLIATLYREEGYSEWREGDDSELVPLNRDGEPTDAELVQAYKTTTAYIPADGETVVAGEENYGVLPIVPMWASRLKQSTLVGLRAHIDAYDLVKSGFANDLQDCATAYWIVENAMGMTDDDLAEFRDRLRLEHIAKVDGTDGAKATQYTQEIPYAARQALLAELRNGIYEDFGALDVHAVAAGATNDHIDAAYQPMDENAADFEYWVGECIRQLVKLAGFDDAPIFQRNRISNQKEQVEMVVQEAQWLDNATILRKLPNIRPDEVSAILQAMDGEDMDRFGFGAGGAETESEALLGAGAAPSPETGSSDGSGLLDSAQAGRVADIAGRIARGEVTEAQVVELVVLMTGLDAARVRGILAGTKEVKPE